MCNISYPLSIDMSEAPKGIYFLKIKSGREENTIKLAVE